MGDDGEVGSAKRMLLPFGSYAKVAAIQVVVGHIPHLQLAEDVGAILSSQAVHWAVNTLFRSHFDSGQSSNRLVRRALDERDQRGSACKAEAGKPRAAALRACEARDIVARLDSLSVADGPATAASGEARRSTTFCLLAALDDDVLLHIFARVW